MEKITSKKAAMEMSVGTIVTIVLLMTVLVLGLVMIRSIFRSTTTSIDSIDQSVKNEINKLFSEDNSKKVVIYPQTRAISLKKGDSGGFGFSIRNIDEADGSFSYEVSVDKNGIACSGMTLRDAQALIIQGGKADNINIPSGDSLTDPVLVKFKIPETATVCNIRYNLDISEDGKQYAPTISVDLEIQAK
jgi:hypothetical protein